MKGIFRLVVGASCQIAAMLPAAAADTWTGRYVGHMESYDWKATITAKAPEVYGLHETVSSRMPLCSGELDTTAKLVGDKLVVSDDDCSLTITKRGTRRIKVDEKGCNTWHGAACGFDADIMRR